MRRCDAILDGECRLKRPDAELYMSEPVALTILFAIAFFLNIPLGLLRRRSRRWTLPWIIGCDGSVPILILLRKYVLDVGGLDVIVPEVLLALAGNIYGPRIWLRLRRQSVQPEAEPLAT